MGGVLHGCARTTPRVRAELQGSQEPTRALARRYRRNPKTVAKWRARAATADAPTGPRARRSTVLTAQEEAADVAFRRRALLPLDDLLGCLRGRIPALTRSALHRCLQRPGVSRLPGREEKAPRRGRFAETAIGYVHVGACELRSAEGTAHLFVAVDRVCKFAHVELHRRVTMAAGAAFLRSVLAALPYRVHTVLTDNGVPFAAQARYRAGPTETYGGHPLGRVCRAHGVRHKLTRPYHPWTNGQAERMVRTPKGATVRAYHYDTHADRATHLQAFVTARNFARHLQALRWRTPYEAICAAWAADPRPFKLDPHHLIPGPHT